MLPPAGLTSMRVSVVWKTTRFELPLNPPKLEAIDVAPVESVVASPLLPTALEMLATAGALELQVAWAVRFWVLPSV